MNEGARELVIARAEQAESNAEDVFFDNCKFEGTREQRRIFQAGWRCGQDYGESLFLEPTEVGVAYPPHYAENQSRVFDPTKDHLIDPIDEELPSLKVKSTSDWIREHNSNNIDEPSGD
jgi:hypothetical protein